MTRTHISSIFSIALLFSIAIFAEISMDENKDNTLKIRWVIDEALRSNPELQSAKLRWSASTESIRQERGG